MYSVNLEHAQSVAQLRQESIGHLAFLCQLVNERLGEKEEAELVLGTMGMIANNVLLSVASEEWLCSRPRVDIRLVGLWMEAEKKAEQLYGLTGLGACERVREDMRGNFICQKALAEAGL